MSNPLPRRQYDADAENLYFWESPISERDIQLRISLGALSQAIDLAEPTQMTGNTKAALVTLGNACRRSGYGALACICSDMLERIEDTAAGCFNPRSRDLFGRWLLYVEDYLNSPIRYQILSAIINTHRQIWSYPPLSRRDRVLLVRALRCGGR